MKYWCMVCLAGILGLCGGKAQAQDRSFNAGYDDYGPYGYRTFQEWRSIREIMFRRTGLEDTLRLRTLGKSVDLFICPWWLEDLYRPDVIRAKFRRLGYPGYVLNPLSGLPSLTNSWNAAVLTDSAWADVPVDLVVYCRGADAFDYFLRSDSSRMNFLRAVFDPDRGLVNTLHAGRRPAGVHFYLPDFSFREKRAFMQFVRSVSMVIDNFCIEGIRPYEGDHCRLTFTFSSGAKEHLNYLSGVIAMADEVHFADYDEYGFPLRQPEVYTRHNDPTPLLYQVLDQFYLFSLHGSVEAVENGCCSDLQLLAQAEYSVYHWRWYFLLDVLLTLAVIVLVVLYNFCSPFYMLAGHYRWLVAPVMITLVTEILIVCLYMVEALSKTQLFFDMSRNTHLFLLALPVLFILIYMALKISGGHKQLP